jgi:predicted ATPase
LEINGTRDSYEVSFSRDSLAERVLVNGEVLFESTGGECHYVDRKHLLKVTTSTYSCNFFDTVIYPPPLLMNCPSDAREEVLEVKSFLQRMKFYSFEPSRIRPAIPIKNTWDLAYDGYNLARALLHLYHNKRKTFDKIENCLKDLVPEVEEIILDIPEGSTDIYLRILEKNFGESHSPYRISDGTLRLLAFITAVHTEASFVTFEEPENCIHPHLLEALIDLLRKAPCQVLVTTHSPYLLDYAEPEEVIVVEKVEGETKASRLSEHEQIETVKEMLKGGLKMGEIWHGGLFGGIPRSG